MIQQKKMTPKIKIRKTIKNGDRTYNLKFKNHPFDRKTIRVKGYEIEKIKNAGFEEYEVTDFLSLSFDLETGDCFESYEDYEKWFIDFIRREVLKIKKGLKIK